MPSWSWFNATQAKAKLSEKSGYLPVIPLPPTESSVIHELLCHSCAIKAPPWQAHCIIYKGRSAGLREGPLKFTGNIVNNVLSCHSLLDVYPLWVSTDLLQLCAWLCAVHRWACLASSFNFRIITNSWISMPSRYELLPGKHWNIIHHQWTPGTSQTTEMSLISLMTIPKITWERNTSSFMIYKFIIRACLQLLPVSRPRSKLISFFQTTLLPVDSPYKQIPGYKNLSETVSQIEL